MLSQPITNQFKAYCNSCEFSSSILCLLISILVFLSNFGKNMQAQDISFSQYYALPLHVNPALAGTANAPRFTLAYRNQWPSLGKGFLGGFATYAAGYDQHFEKIKSSIGVWFTSDHIAADLMMSNSISLMWAVQVRLNKKMGLRFAIEGNYTNRKVNWNELLYGDQIDPLYGFFQGIRIPNPTNELTPQSFNSNLFDVGLGGLYFTRKYYAGFSVKHLARPNDAMKGFKESRLPILYSIHGGAVIPLKARRLDKFYLAPSILFLQQKNMSQINVGMLLNVQLGYGGIWFRHNIRNPDAVIFVLGIRKGIFRAGYSYDLTVSRLGRGTGGTHEVTMTFAIGKDDNSLNPRSRSGILSCPEILKY